MAPTRQQLSQREIDAVLKHYNVGTVHEITELPEGSVYSPKVILKADKGRLLLKRRARGLDIPAVVAFSHEVMLECLKQGLCVPPLIATTDNNSMVQHADHVYELFPFIEGQRFDPAKPAHAREMGELLSDTYAYMDKLKTTFEPVVEPETIDRTRINPITPHRDALPADLVDDFKRALDHGADTAAANEKPKAIVHGDWHPGNMIYRQDRLVAVCDFDNTRIGSRDREIAQALVHVSLITPQPGQTASAVPPEPDPARLEAFWHGYKAHNGQSSPRAIAALMPAVMIDEALASIGPELNDNRVALLTAVHRKANWLSDHHQNLVALFSD